MEKETKTNITKTKNGITATVTTKEDDLTLKEKFKLDENKKKWIPVKQEVEEKK